MTEQKWTMMEQKIIEYACKNKSWEAIEIKTREDWCFVVEREKKQLTNRDGGQFPGSFGLARSRKEKNSIPTLKSLGKGLFV